MLINTKRLFSKERKWKVSKETLRRFVFTVLKERNKGRKYVKKVENMKSVYF